jgi:hypothetical protein
LTLYKYVVNICTMSDTDTTIYWSVVRNQTKRVGYLELEYLGNKRWSAVLDENEFKFQTAETEYWKVLQAAIQARPV